MNSIARSSELPEKPVETRLRLLTFILLAYAFFGAVISFAGWAADLPRLADWFRTQVSIQPNAAVAIAILSLSVVFLLIGRSYISTFLGLAVFLIGGTALFQTLTGIDLGIDRYLLFGREWGQDGTISIGRMGKPGSVSLILLGSAIVLISLSQSGRFLPSLRGYRMGAVVLVLVALTVSALTLLGYIYGATQLYTIPQITTVAIQTATFVAAIALALLVFVTDVGPGKLLSDPGPGGELIRRLVPAVLIVSLALGGLTLAGGRLQLYDPAFEASIRTIIEIVLLLALVWWAVRTISAHIRRIKEHETELQELADAMPQLVWIAGSDGTVAYYNARSTEYNGLSKDRANSYDWQPIVHPDDLEATVEAWRSAVETTSVYELEHRIRMADGSFRWHLSRAFPTRTNDANGLKWYGTATDIEHVKRAEAELRGTEERLQQALDAGRIGVWEYRPADRRLILDERCRELSGIERSEEIDPTTAEKIVFENDLQLLRARLRSAWSKSPEKRVTAEIRVRTPNAGVRWLHVIGQTSDTSNGGGRILRGTAIDITERKTAEANQNFLFSVAEVIRLSDDPNELLQQVCELVGKYLGVDRCMFLETDVENDRRRTLSRYSRNGRGGERVAGYSSYSPATLGQMMNGQTVIVANSQIDPRTAEYFDRSYGPNSEVAYVAVPLLRDRKWVAALWASDDKPRAWNDLEVGVLEAVGERAWTAIERIRAENAVRESEKRFRNVSDSAPVMIWVADTENNGTWFNRPWLEFTGRPLEDEIGTGWLELIHPDDREATANVCMAAFNIRKEFTMEFRMRRADGQYRWLKDSGVPRFGPDGEFLGYIGSCVDIHEIKSAAEALRSSEARLTLATTIGKFGMWDINYAEGKMIWSDRLFEIFGVDPTPDKWMEMSQFESMVEPRDLQRVRDLSFTAIEKHEAYSAEYRIVKADTGETRWIDARAQFFYDDAGTVVRSVGIAHDVTDRRAEQEALRLSEERLKLAQDAGGIGIWDWDARDDHTFWSERMWAIYGEDPVSEKVPNDYWLGFLHEDDRERLEQAARGLLDSKDPEFRHEFRIVRRNGEIRWLETIARIDRHPDGTVDRVYGITVDITDKKTAAEKLRISEANLRLVTDSIPALVSYIDSTEHYRFANRQYREWFGLELDDIVGKSMVELLGEEAYRVFKPRVDEALGGTATSFDTWANYMNAGRRYVHVSYVPDRNEVGNVAGFYVLVTDLTDLRRSEELLRLSEERMRLLTESFTDYAILSTDVEGRIDSWNPGASTIFGYSEEEVIGRPSDILFTPEDVRKGIPLREMQDARTNGRAIDERWHVRKDGSRFFAMGVMAPLFVGDVLTGYAKIASDLTEKKRNAEALQRAHDEMEHRVVERTREIAAMNEVLLREINDRKTAERQKIELLQRLVSSQEDERRRIARDLHDQLGQRLTALRLKLASLREASAQNEEFAFRIERLQDIAALLDSEVGFLTWELRPSAIDELGLVNAIRAFVAEWSRHFDLEVDFHSAGLADVEFRHEVEIQLYRIVQEALNNVVKHANATRVEVLFERAGDSAVMIVEDNGVGFENGKPRPAGHAPGGFGLSGIRERTELIGGTLNIDTEPGRGTTILVRIPIEQSLFTELNDE